MSNGAPGFNRAIKLLAYDNGAITRFRDEDLVLYHIYRRLNEKYTEEELDALEAELCSLSDRLLEEICTGEQLDFPITPQLHKALNFIFESL